MVQKINLTALHNLCTNPYFTYFILLSLFIVLILFSSVLDTHKQQSLISFIRLPFVLIPIVVVIIIISHFNMFLAVVLLLALLLVIWLPVPLYPHYYANVRGNEGSMSPPVIGGYGGAQSLPEGFKTKYEADEDEKETSTQYYVDNAKKLITGNMKSVAEHHENELKKGVLDNKKKLLQSVKENSNEDTDKGSDSMAISKKSKIVTKRKFNPNKEDDTNLLITKEILVDMINRIEYNYETVAYLKKYIKARLEEIIDTNNLLDE